MLFSYVVYGLSFFILWIVLLVYNASLSKYSLVRKLWLLALFAITHGLHDWIGVFMALEQYENVYLRTFNLFLLAISFYFLIHFGVSSGIFRNQYRFLNAAPLALLLLWLAATLTSSQRLLAGDVFARYFIGFPGAVMASYTLFLRLKEEKNVVSAALTRNMAVAAGSFLGYAFFSGLITPPADFFPASAFNYVTFADKVGVPVHFFRALCVMAITYALSQVFSIFEINLRDSLKREKETLEDEVRERTAELTRSNGQLETEIRERKIVEETLLAREREQKAMLDNIPDLAWLKDREGRFIAVNEAMGVACGMRPAELTGKTDLDIWPKELAERYRADDRDVIERGRRKQVEEPMVDRFGGTGWIETIKTPIFDDQGLVIGTTGIARDITERRKAEDALLQSEKRYRQLFENMQEGFLIQDIVVDDSGKPVDVRYLDANPAAERFLGKTRAEIIGKTRNQVLETPDPEVVGAISRVAGTGQPFHMVRYSSGAKRWYESFSYSFGTGLVATLILDITERKQVEAALQHREKQLAESQRIAHIGSWERNLATGDMFWSDELFRIFGLDPKTDNVDFKIFSDIIHADDRPALRKAINEAIQLNKPYGIDYRITRKDGEHRILHAQAELRRDETGTQAILSGTAQDITERTLADEKVRQSEAKYRNLFESSSDGIFILGLDGSFIDMNRTAYTRLGYTKAELLALHISKLDDPEFASRAPERMRQVSENGIAVFESAHLRKDGTAMPVEVNSRLIEYDGKMVYLSVVRDITERKQAEHTLQEKTKQLEDLTRDLERRVAEEIAVRLKNERMMIQQSKLAAMGEMIGAIAHQWRQPLNVVGLIVQRMEDVYAQGKLDKGYLEQTVERVMTQILRMSKTIDDFRNFYKPDKEKAVFDAMRAIGDVLALVSAQLASDHIFYRLTCHTHGKTVEKEADVVPCAEKAIEGFRNEFEHVILNLVNNARDAIIEKKGRGGMGASERGLLSFDFYNANDKVIIKVSDNGGGIPAQAMGNIFAPYFTTKEPAKGTGLGLYMSKMVVEDHMHGKLSADNGEEGAIFTIELPHPERVVS